MAERGFNVTDEQAVIGAHLEVPAYTKGKRQLSGMDVERLRQLARVRIHLERVIRSTKKRNIKLSKIPFQLVLSSVQKTKK